MVFTPNDLAAMTPTGNYFLMNDIDLNAFTGGGPTPIDWVGKTNYSGNFNGNGHTINLTLKKTNGDTGLFTSLASGAIIENFTLNVVTPQDPLRMSANSHFGGVVGVIDLDGTYNIRNIAVTGSLKYGSQTAANLYLIVGGLIGEIREGGFAVKLYIDNCSADLAVDADLGNLTQSSIGNLVSFGGLIGKVAANKVNNETIIKNSYSTGYLHVKSGLGRMLVAGGLIGDVSAGTTIASNLNTQITNCYSAMDILATREGGSAAHGVYVGGLVSRFSTNNANANITKSVAINPKVLVISASGTKMAYRSFYRIAGSIPASAQTYALDSMLVGASPGAVATADIAATGYNGANATLTDLSSSAFWRDLDFDGNIWDFTGLNISEGIYPRLIR
jgi:hypothetical protein